MNYRPEVRILSYLFAWKKNDEISTLRCWPFVRIYGLGTVLSVPTLIFEAPSQSAFTAGFAVLGLVIDVLAIIAFWQAKTTLSPFHPENARALVTGGIYQYSRNPMYLGLLCYLIAWTYHLAHPFAAFGPVAFVMLMNTGQIKREETALLAPLAMTTASI